MEAPQNFGWNVLSLLWVIHDLQMDQTNTKRHASSCLCRARDCQTLTGNNETHRRFLVCNLLLTQSTVSLAANIVLQRRQNLLENLDIRRPRKWSSVSANPETSGQRIMDVPNFFGHTTQVERFFNSEPRLVGSRSNLGIKKKLTSRPGCCERN